VVLGLTGLTANSFLLVSSLLQIMFVKFQTESSGFCIDAIVWQWWRLDPTVSVTGWNMLWSSWNLADPIGQDDLVLISIVLHRLYKRVALPYSWSKRAVRIILYPLTLPVPYITALGYLKLESLKHRRTEADKKFFNSISQPDSCLHHLLPLPRDTQPITKLRCANTYPVPLIKTKRFFLSIMAWRIM